MLGHSLGLVIGEVNWIQTPQIKPYGKYGAKWLNNMPSVDVISLAVVMLQGVRWRAREQNL
jgi:hypothetical protein